MIETLTTYWQFLKKPKYLRFSKDKKMLIKETQAFRGLSRGYIRVKHGLVYSILLPASFNLIAILLDFLFS
ncbi:hypothetical protein GJU39_04510 [Pedobacter petrophilus]|uniref:Uncharacterized protein n=1 Tax=Pedobacter petrophilus TaxID=1908241 RepID=A0A7K0FW77_9SPHI|nr:hypothetical protein [Pedobacter petrophilus]MRX75344.1 hypothetical protein [Pedobacter petrophilus]